MPTMNYIQALNSALKNELGRDENIVILGEDVGKAGGVFRVTDGLQALFGEDRVIFLEPKKLYRGATAEVPEEPYTVPIGPAKLLREGNDVTVVTWGVMVGTCQQACEQAAKEQGIECDLIDLRTLAPLDTDAI